VNATPDGGIEYEQRAQAVFCLKSHLGKEIDPDTGVENEVRICDQAEKRELPPVAVKIHSCD
jgi:hypothetical protein